MCTFFLDIGKKVRKGQRPKKTRSKSRKRSTPTSTSTTSPVTSSTSNANIGDAPLSASGETKIEDGVARAVRLAANLSNQLFVDLPPEPRTEAGTVTTNERKPRGSKQKGGQDRVGGGRQRKHKSLSPEKRLASTLAQSMSSISKSFEKLDLIGHHRKRSRSHHDQQKKRKRSEAAAATGSSASATNKEVTIAKLGRFKFSVEVAKQFEAERSKKTDKPFSNSSSSKSRKISEVTKKTIGELYYSFVH